MKDNPQNRADHDDLRAAAEWWTRLRDPQAGDATRQWVEWSGADNRRAEAFERVSELGVQLHTLDTQSKASLVDEFVPFGARMPARPRWMSLGMVASVAALAVSALVSGYFLKVGLDRPQEERFASQIAENREIVLGDGSKVALAGDSALQTQFSRKERNLTLQRGEAFFEVAHDTRRPFVVAAGKLSVRAVGTAFDVRRVGARVNVAITQGRVRISYAEAGGADPLAIEAVAGQQVSYDPAASGLTVSNIDPAMAAPWRDNRLEFVDEPLADVVESINRYSRRPLRLEGDGLGGLQFTGSVRLDNLDGWLSALPQVLPVKVVESGDRILLYAAPVSGN